MGSLFTMTKESIKSSIIKIAYPPFPIHKIIINYLNNNFSNNQNQLKDTSDVYYFKLPHISYLFHYIKNKLPKLCKEFKRKF